MKKVFMIMMLTMSLQADVSLHKSLFSQGSTSVGIRLGSASTGNENYTILGVSGNYFVIENLSVGLGYEKWFSGDPSIQKVTAESTYFIPASEKMRPYLGIFGRRIFISGNDRFGRDYDDINSYGYRVGLAYTKDRLLISAGLVQEKYESREGFLDSTETYAELTLGYVF
jgi:hypothetical protein